MADDAASYGSRGGLVNRRGGVRTSQESGSGKMYQVGQPIGYMAARGTPYEKKYFTKKLGFCCLFLAPPIFLIVLAITLVPVLWAVANHALHTAQMHIYSSNITAPGNGSFPLTLEGQVKKTGIFPAHLYFRKPVDVYWMSPPDSPNGMQELHLGSLKLGQIGAAAGHARIKQATTFDIIDEAGFGLFAEYLITKEEFTWQLRCPEVHAEAFSFLPTYKSFNFVKNVVIKGINGFDDVKIINLQLPGDDPAGGITVQTITQLVNPSPFGVQVGNLALDLFYKGMYLGPVRSENLNLTSGVNIVSLIGRLVPHADNATELGLLGELFTNYINGDASPVVARGVSTTQANGETIGWLSQGIKALQVDIPFQSPERIDPIKGIQIDYISLAWKEEKPWNPDISSNDLTGVLSLPFGFSLNISQLATQLNIEYEGAPVGSVQGPFAPSDLNLTTISVGETSGTIAIALPESELLLPNNTDAARRQLVKFQNAFTFSDQASFTAKGSAKAITDTPLGRLLLDGVRFNVTTGLKGLQGLVKYPTIINTVDVVGGTAEAIELNLGLTLVNPSNLNLTVGDAVFEVVNGVALGTATLSNLALKIGRNDVNGTSSFDANRDAKGLETLNRFISGLDTTLNITGFSGSSKIESLAPTLAPLRLNASLPGLQVPLIGAANLTVLPTTGITDDIANSIVQLVNPFSAPLGIQRIQANASANGVFLASIDTALNFNAPGKASTGSPLIPLALNLYPSDIFAVLRSFAIQAGLNPAYIDGVVALGGFTLSPTTPVSAPAAAKRDGEDSVVFEEDNEVAHMLMGVGANPGAALSDADAHEDEGYAEEYEGGASAKRALPLPSAGLAKRANLYTGFKLTDYVRDAFRVGKLDLSIVSDTLIGDYGTTLTFSQQGVALGTDDTLFLLLPVLAGPIVQKIVDGAVLNIDRITITEARPTSFTANLQGSLTNSGPFDGVVSFPQGLTIFYEGRVLTQTAFPNITLTGDLGAAISVELQGEIPDVPFFTQFLKDAITSPSFEWNIRGEGLTVDAIGISIPNITLNKDVQLTGLNGLKGQVIINSFDLPSNAPEGGISLTAVSTINNPAQVGVALSRFGIQISSNGSLIGPSAAEQPFTLQALAVTTVPLAGRIVPQEGAGLDVLSQVFTNFVANVNTPLVVEGAYAGPADVVWLNEGIKVLRVDVSLPSQDFDVIRLISLNQLSLVFTKQTEWAPLTSSSDTDAHFFLPFGLPIDIKTVEGPFIARYNGVDAAVLNIPRSDTVTDVEARILSLMFNNVPFAVYNNGRAAFSQFIADTTAREQVTFNLHGTATSDAQTGAGVVNIRNIPFDLNTNLLGLQNLNARPAIVSDLDVRRGYPDRLEITVLTALFNPSDITISTGTVTFEVRFLDRPIGNAVLNDLTLVPGENKVPTLINYQPRGSENVRAGQTLLENYVSNITSDAVVQGTRQTTDIASLQQALAGITLRTSIPSLGKLIVQQANLFVPRDIGQNGGIAQVSVLIANPFTASLNIVQLYAQANYAGITLGTIDTRLNPPIFAPGRATTQSQRIPIKLDLNPKTLVRFILAAAQNTGTDLGPFPPFLQRILDLPNTDTTIIPIPDTADPPCNSGGFDLRPAVLQALRGLATSIPLRTTTDIDQYRTQLNFLQEPVPTIVDDSVLYLLGPAGAPLIKIIVDESVLRVDIANATSLTNSGFYTSLAGALIASTPTNALIEFNEPLAIEWQGSVIAEIALPPICVSAPDGVPNLQTAGQLTIRNQRRFTDFASYLLNNPSFQWTLSSDKVTVRALGIRYTNVSLRKTIELDAFDGLPGVTISKFDAPSDAPGRINIVVDTSIPSRASLGVELGEASFELFFMGTDIGEATASDLFLAAKATTNTVLRGFLRKQSGRGLENVGILFSRYLAGENSTLQVQGKQVISPASNGQPVKWLSDAFKTLTIDVVLPGQIYQIIFGITLSDLTVELLEPANDGYTAIVSNNETIARFSNPFGFGLGVSKAAVDSVVEYTGDAATLNLPSRTPLRSGVSRGPQDIQDLVINFRDEDLVAIDRGAYQRFFARTTNFPEVDFVLKGSVDVISSTEIGAIPISGIPFNVTTSLKGINNFNGVAELNDVNVRDATSDYISIPLITTLENPSDITLFTDNVRLPVLKDGVEAGRAYLSPLNLYPGPNQLKTDFRYGPANAADPVAQSLVQAYLQPPAGQETGIQITPLQIQGRLRANPTLSPYDGLELALAGVSAKTELAGIGSRIVRKIDNYITFNSLIQALTLQPTFIETRLTLRNDLPIPLDILQLQSKVYDNTRPGDGLQASFDYTFKVPQRTPAAPATGQGSADGTVGTERITNVRLQNGLLGALPLVGHNLNVDNVIRVNVVGKSGTYELPSLNYNQVNIDSDYYIELLGPGSGIPLDGIGALLTGLNSLTGDALFQVLLAIGKLSTGQIPQTILSIPEVAQTICKREDEVRINPAIDDIINFGINTLNTLKCGPQIQRIAASSSSSAASASATSASAASAASNAAAASASAAAAATTTPAASNTPAATTPAAGNRVAGAATTAA